MNRAHAHVQRPHINARPRAAFLQKPLFRDDLFATSL
jgi:hypothetical protein